MYKVLLIIFLSLALFAENKTSENSDFSNMSKFKIEEILQYIVSQSVKNLPLQIDSITTLVNVQTNKNKYKYIKQIDTNVGFLKDVTKDVSKESLLNTLQIKLINADASTACKEPFFKYLIYERNAVFEYVYETKDSLPLFEHSVGIKDCEKL